MHSKTPNGAEPLTSDSGKSSSTLSEQLAAYHQDSPFSPYDEATGLGLERPDPTLGELLVPYVAPGKAASVPIGVMYRADHETLDDGMCRQARTHASALAAAGVPVALRTIGNRVRHGERYLIAADDVLAPEVWQQVGTLRRVQMQRTAILIVHAVIQSATHLWRLLVPDYIALDDKAVEAALGASIVYTPWERDRVHPDIIALLSRVGQVWLQCQRNVEAFVNSGLPAEKIRVVPNAYDEQAEIFTRAPLRVPVGKRYYNIGKWEPRKDQHALIGAFLLTHRPGQPVSLFIKTFDYRPWPDYPAADASVGIWLRDERVQANGWTVANAARHIIIDQRVFSENEIAKLHHLSNIYVSPSHAEGWDYPAFDAFAIGNRLVHVGYGGSEDYASSSDVRIPWKLGPVHSAYRWEDGAVWAVYEHDELVAALAKAEPRLTRSSPPAVKRFSSNSVGRRMREHVAELAAVMTPELLEAIQ